jgi:hypothetical protein
VEVSAVQVAADVIGLSEDAARSRVEIDGFIWRVIVRDGVDILRRSDLRRNRVSVEITHGTVTGARVA